jgi:hypothetical protein
MFSALNGPNKRKDFVISHGEASVMNWFAGFARETFASVEMSNKQTKENINF